MRDYYRLSFPITSAKRKLWQKLLLISAIVLDIANVFVLIEVIYGSLFYLFLMAGLFITSTITRIMSLKLNYSYEYLMNNGVFRILKAYSMKSCEIVKMDGSSNFVLKEVVHRESTGTRLYNAATELNLYQLTLDGKIYLIALNEYMFALIDNLKEKNYDLS